MGAQAEPMNLDKRHVVVVGVFALATFLLGLRLFQLTILDNDFLIKEGIKRAERTQPIPTTRGAILDRNGEPLAISSPVPSIWIDPSLSEFSSTQITEIASVLSLDNGLLEQKIRKSTQRRFMYLKRRVTPRVAEEVRQLEIPGVHIDAEYNRFYPLGEITAHVVGITDPDENGLEGLELASNDRLSGTPGFRRILQDAAGSSIKDVETMKPPEFGEDLELTLDARLQYVAHQALDNAIKLNDANAGTVILVHVDSGSLLTLVNLPTFDPNQARVPSDPTRRNLAVMSLIEPGSTVKPFLALAAMETGRYFPDTQIDTNPGRFRVRRKVVEDPRNYGVLSLSQLLAKSSQVGAAKMALDLDPFQVLDVYSRVGLEHNPNTGLAGETEGRFPVENIDREVERVTRGYGYGISITPMQLAQAYLTLATGGVLRQIKIHKSQQGFKDERVVDRRHATTLLHMLEGVVSPIGTASRAGIPGIRVAGKTGTSRKLVDGEYQEGIHTALFVGIAPVDNPQFVCVVVIDEPMGILRSGGSVSAPVFAQIVTRAFILMGLDGDGHQLRINQERNDAA